MHTNLVEHEIGIIPRSDINCMQFFSSAQSVKLNAEETAMWNTVIVLVICTLPTYKLVRVIRKSQYLKLAGGRAFAALQLMACAAITRATTIKRN